MTHRQEGRGGYMLITYEMMKQREDVRELLCGAQKVFQPVIFVVVERV